MARMKSSHALTFAAVAVALLSAARLDAATASAPMTVSVRVIARAVITIENEGDVVVTHDDIERGYVELTSPIVLNVRTNSRRGYVLEVAKSNEAFSAVELYVTFHGVGVHPGTAKGKLVNPLKLAARFISSLPAETLSPETTEGREGYVHPYAIEGGAESVKVTMILRDHDGARLEEHEALVRRLAEEAVAADPRASVTFDRWEQYRNMREYLDPVPEVTDAAEAAIRLAGVEPRRVPIRGGTDGSRLSEMGLPTPNIFTGGHEYHSVREWASLQDMAASAATVVKLAEVWARGGQVGSDR